MPLPRPRLRGYDVLSEYRTSPLSGYGLPRAAAAFPAAEDPEYDSVRHLLLDNSLQGLAYVGSVLDKAGGARAIRGLLGGRPRELLSVLPFSDTLGITDYDQRVTGEDLLTGKGLLPALVAENDPERSQLRDLVGPLLEIATDPLSFLSPLPLTEAGLSALRAGTLARGLSSGVRAGERALLGAGLPFRHPSLLLGSAASAVGGRSLLGGLEGAERLGSAIYRARIPGTSLRPLAQLGGLFHYPFAGTSHPDAQAVASEVFTPLRESLEAEGRAFEAAQRDVLESLITSGGTIDESLRLRGLGESRPENLAVDDPLGPVGEALRSRDVGRLRRLQEAGVRVPVLERHLPRSLARVPGRAPSSGVPRPFLPTRSSIQTGRRVPAIPGLTPVQEELIGDPNVSGAAALLTDPRERSAYVLRRVLREQSAGLTPEAIAGTVGALPDRLLRRLAVQVDLSLTAAQLADPEGLRQFLVGAVPEARIGVLTPETFRDAVAGLDPRRQLSVFPQGSPLHGLRRQSRRFADYISTLSPEHSAAGRPLFNPDVLADVARADRQAATQEAAARAVTEALGRYGRPVGELEREGVPFVTLDRVLGGGQRRVQSASLTFNEAEPVTDAAGEVVGHAHRGARASVARRLGLAEDELSALDHRGLRDYLRRFAVPQDLANDLSRFNQRFFVDPAVGPFRDVLGQLNSLFRGIVYPSFLSSHTRNLTTAAYNNLRSGGVYPEGGVLERLIGPYRDALRLRRGEVPLAGLPERYLSVPRTAEELANPPVRTFGPSTAEVTHFDYPREAVDEAVRNILGPGATVQDLASVVGAPAGSRVNVAVDDPATIRIAIQGDGLRASRTLARDPETGRPLLQGDFITIDPSLRGRGLGTEVFARQVEAARRLGVERFSLEAASGGGGDFSEMVGHLVWPKYGFEGELPYTVRYNIREGHIPAPPHGEATVQALYATPEGQAWWEQFGQTVPLSFEFNPSSPSSRVFEGYLRRRGLVESLSPTRPGTPEETVRNYLRDVYARGVALRPQTLQEGLGTPAAPSRLFAPPVGVRPSVGLLEGLTANPLDIAGFGGRERTRFAPAAVGNRLGSGIEETVRIAQDLALQARGYTPEAAAAEVARTHFDYSRLSPAEQFARQTLFPFYTFTRNNIERQLRLLLRRPSDITVPVRVLSSLRGSSYVPGYLGGEAVIPVGGETPEGQQRYIGTLGLPEEEAFGRVRSDPLTGVMGGTALAYGGLLTPYLRSPLELLSNRQFYSGRQLSDLRPYGLATGYGVLAPNDPKAQLLAQAIGTTPLSRVVGTIDKLIDARKGVLPKVLNLGTGLRVTDVDVGAARAVEVRRLLEQALRSSLNVSTITEFYVPPELQGQVDPRTAELLRVYARGRLEARRAAEARR